MAERNDRDQHQPDRSERGAAALPGDERRVGCRGLRSRCRTHSSGSRTPERSPGARRLPRAAAAPVPAVRRRATHEVTEGSSVRTTRFRSRSTSEWAGLRAGWDGRLSYTWSRHQGQPVGGKQHLPDPDTPQNNYDLNAEDRVEHLQLAAPDHPGADRQDPSPADGGSLSIAPGWRMERVGDRGDGERCAAQRRAQLRRVGANLGSARRSSAPQSFPGDPNTDGSDDERVSPSRADHPARFFDGGCVHEPRRWAPTATRLVPTVMPGGPVPGRTSTSSLPKDTRFGSQTGQIGFEIEWTNTAKFRGIDSKKMR